MSVPTHDKFDWIFVVSKFERSLLYFILKKLGGP